MTKILLCKQNKCFGLIAIEKHLLCIFHLLSKRYFSYAIYKISFSFFLKSWSVVKVLRETAIPSFSIFLLAFVSNTVYMMHLISTLNGRLRKLVDSFKLKERLGKIIADSRKYFAETTNGGKKDQS